MISFPNCKINLGLNVTEKRDDGFHNIESCFYPVKWMDILEFIPSNEIKFSKSGLPIPENGSENLCIKTWKALNQLVGIRPVHFHLHKNIPIGAGLGGGSADAAFTAKFLNKAFSLNLTETELENLVKPLGSDCAFFIKNKPVLAFGKGDEFKNIQFSLKGKWIILVYPKIHISTVEAYSGVTPTPSENNIQDILQSDLSTWKDSLKNDFEKNLFVKYPVLDEIKKDLYSSGAVYASMTGSGSCLYGLFENEPSLSPFQKSGYIIHKTLLD